MKTKTAKILSIAGALLLVTVLTILLIVCSGKNRQGEQGIPGTPGSNGLTPFIGENGNWWIGESDTGVSAVGRDGRDGIDGKDGRDGVDGKDGDDGAPGAKGDPGNNGASGRDVTSFEINNDGELVVLYSDGAAQNLGKIVPEDAKECSAIETAEIKDGDLVITMTDGRVLNVGNVKGEAASQPMIRINVDTKQWEVSYDSGKSWKDLGSSAVSDVKDGITPQIRINADTKEWEVSYDNGVNWLLLGYNASAQQSLMGNTPMLRLNYDTKQWEVSYDNGRTWDDAGYSGRNEGEINERVIVNIEIIDGYLWVTYEDSDTPVNMGKVPA